MNLLAHIYLSGDSEKLLIGNFIADFIKGNRFKHYEDEIIKGIFVHRKIDSYTDQHPVVKESMAHLRPSFGLFSGIIVDIFYDHFLARNFALYADESLEDFAQKSYRILQEYRQVLPPKVQEFLPYMMKQNWLINYGTREGIYKSLKGISRRSTYAHELENAVGHLEAYYEEFNQEFQRFFPDIQNYVANLEAEDLFKTVKS